MNLFANYSPCNYIARVRLHGSMCSIYLDQYLYTYWSNGYILASNGEPVTPDLFLYLRLCALVRHVIGHLNGSINPDPNWCMACTTREQIKHKVYKKIELISPLIVVSYSSSSSASCCFLASSAAWVAAVVVAMGAGVQHCCFFAPLKNPFQVPLLLQKLNKRTQRIQFL